MAFLSLFLAVVSSAIANPPTADRKLKILVADDEPMIRELLVMIISSADSQIEFIEASSGQEILEILEREPNIDLVISDNTMPVAGSSWIYGYEVLERMRAQEKFKNIPFLIHSTDLDVGGVTLSTRIKQLKGNGFIPKPLSAAQLIALVGEATKSIRAGRPVEIFEDCVKALTGIGGPS